MRRAHLLVVGGAAIGLAFAALPLWAQEPATPATEEHAGEEHGTPHYPIEIPERQSWSFAGPFGTYDAAQLQRGLQVFRTVCGNCHGLSRVAFRTLAAENGPFLSEEEMRAVAASYRVADADTGELREGRPADYFPTPAYPGTPPDLSLMAKARGVSDGFRWMLDPFTQYQEAGVNYIFALLTGYEPAPEGVAVPAGTFYNPYFIAGPSLSMPPPLRDGAVRYGDGTPETLEQYAADVATFLMWAAEPKLVDRKRLGFQVMIFLVLFAGLAYFAKRTVWSKEH
jgi:ubiquinol-cytochrome c reductase cytochrome c1 subunit